MRLQRITILVIVGVVVFGFASVTASWAAPDQDTARQTVPTRTPVPPPPQPEHEKEEKDTPTPMPTVAALAVTPGATPRAVAGGQPSTLPPAGVALGLVPLGLAAVGVVLTGMGWLTRRIRSH